MNQKTIPTLIGVFVVGAVALSVAGVVFFGGGDTFVERVPYVMYFDDSLNGLDVGAPVMFRGVRLGSVTQIILRYYAEEEKPEIPVFVELLPNSVEHIGPEAEKYEVMRMLVKDQGLRAQLATESFVTGKLGIQLGFHPDHEERYVGNDSEVMEIPTIPSEITELKQKLQDIPIEETLNDVREAFASVKELIESKEIREAIASINNTVVEFGELAKKVEGKVDPLAQSVQDAFDGANDLVRSQELANAINSFDSAVNDFGKLVRNADSEIAPLSSKLQETFATLDSTLVTVQGVVRKDSPLHYEITNALKEVAEAAQAVGELAELLKRRPEILLQGKK